MTDSCNTPAKKKKEKKAQKNTYKQQLNAEPQKHQAAILGPFP